MSNIAFITLISGRVQGVYYRAFAEQSAKLLGIHGYVRNQPDGTVEVAAEGEKETLEIFLEDLRQGPRHARVEKITITWQASSGQYKDFTIKG